MSDPSPNEDQLPERLTSEYIETLDLPTAKRLRQELLERKDAIDAQLGTRAKAHRDGTPYSHREYESWRRRTLDAKRYVERDYRKLKQRCIDLTEQAAIGRTKLDAENPIELVHAITALLHQLKAQGVEFDREELDLLIAADHFVNNNPL